MLAGQEVNRERHRGEERRRDADRVEPHVLPHLRDQREPRQREREGRPHAASDRLVPYEPRPERDEHRRGELEEEGDPDRKPLDRDEVEPLDEREPDDPVEDEQGNLVSGDSQTAGRGERDDARQAEKCAGRAQLGQPQLVISGEERITFETLPLTANSRAAALAIA